MLSSEEHFGMKKSKTNVVLQNCSLYIPFRIYKSRPSEIAIHYYKNQAKFFRTNPFVWLCHIGKYFTITGERLNSPTSPNQKLTLRRSVTISIKEITLFKINYHKNFKIFVRNKFIISPWFIESKSNILSTR